MLPSFGKIESITFALSSGDEQVTLRPVIKTETRDDFRGQQISTKMVPCMTTEVSEFQERYSRDTWDENIWGDSDDSEPDKGDSLAPSTCPKSTRHCQQISKFIIDKGAQIKYYSSRMP